MRKTKLQKLYFFSLFAVFFVFQIFCLTTFAQTRTAVRLAAESIVENDVIKLENIAKIEGETSKIGRLKAISLGYAPKAGMLREIRREQISLAIAAAGFAANEILLDAPANILVRRASQNLDEKVLREAVEREVLRNFQAENVTAKIVRLELPQGIALSKGELAVKANTTNVRNFFAPFTVSLEIGVDNIIVRRISATAQVEAFADVLVAGRNLNFNEKIAESDVRIENRKLEKPLANYLRKIENLRGAVLLKNVVSGSELTTDAITAGVVIKNGDSIKIEAVSGKVKIIVSGEARSSGKIGDRIAVKNSQSGAILQATVIDEGLVKVNF